RSGGADHFKLLIACRVSHRQSTPSSSNCAYSPMAEPSKATCQICGRTKSSNSRVIGDNVRATLAEFIRTRHADWKSQEFICFDDLGAFRKEYVKHVLEDEFG